MSKVAAAVAVSLALGVGIGVGQGLVGNRDLPLAWAQNASGRAARSAEEQTVIRVARQARPAVVSVSRQGGSGSGVVIRPNGVIVTNAHVVGDAEQVRVRLAGGRTLPGRVLGTDPVVDIAVVKVDAENLPVAPIADSDDLDVGQAAIAIGNPLGLEGTVTTGVVSATNRQRDPDDPVGFIQTDAAINPGNSGGPLLDSQGRVIGINTWIIRANNLGFAVPINVARDVAEQVLTTGRVRRAIMGIQPASVTPEIAARLNLPVRQGAAVAEVTPGSPADRAGIRAEDIITRIDGQAVTSGGDLRRILRRKSAGETVSVTLRRGGRTETVAVRLVEAPVE
jgi:S1-C subfamily serine protease